jgi:hypothetical protein
MKTSSNRWYQVYFACASQKKLRVKGITIVSKERNAGVYPARTFFFPGEPVTLAEVRSAVQDRPETLLGMINNGENAGLDTMVSTNSLHREYLTATNLLNPGARRVIEGCPTEQFIKAVIAKYEALNATVETTNAAQ